MNCHCLDQGWHKQFLTKIQKSTDFESFRRDVFVRAWRVRVSDSNSTSQKLACARPLSRRKTSSNGHKFLSADSSRHALQLSSYKRPPKRPLTRSIKSIKTTHFQAIWPLQPPQSYGVNGHTGCRRSNQTKQISGAAFPGPCFHTKVPAVCL